MSVLSRLALLAAPIERINSAIGRTVAWCALLMVVVQVAVVRFHNGVGPNAPAPEKVITAVELPVMWPTVRASVGTAWQLPQATGAASELPARWLVWAPTRMLVVADDPFPQVGRGGAPVVLLVPPWHMVQLVFQLAPWQLEQAGAAPMPSSVAPWQPWQADSPALAE